MKHLIVLCIAFVISPISAMPAELHPPEEEALSRFLRYVKIDTQSAEDQKQVPSTPKQFDLGRRLEGELKSLGARAVKLTDHALVYATFPDRKRTRLNSSHIP